LCACVISLLPYFSASLACIHYPLVWFDKYKMADAAAPDSERFPAGMKKKPTSFAQKRLAGGQKARFDSADFELNKQSLPGAKLVGWPSLVCVVAAAAAAAANSPDGATFVL
jgi:hypothetical protein